MFAIFKREIRSYFQTVVGWPFIAAVLALYGLYFYAYNLRSGSPYVSYSLSAVSFIVMIAVPVLTMRSFAEERHTKTRFKLRLLNLTPGSAWKDRVWLNHLADGSEFSPLQ